jgi:hypothetical protein
VSRQHGQCRSVVTATSPKPALSDEPERASDLGGAEGIRTPGLLVANSGRHGHERSLQAWLRSRRAHRGRCRPLRLLHFAAALLRSCVLAADRSSRRSGGLPTRLLPLLVWLGPDAVRVTPPELPFSLADLRRAHAGLSTASLALTLRRQPATERVADLYQAAVADCSVGVTPSGTRSAGDVWLAIYRRGYDEFRLPRT